MTLYAAVTSTTPPGPGQSKMFYSPALFDDTTGSYPKASPPSTVAYQTNGSGQFLFFEGATAVNERVWPTGDSGGGGNAYTTEDKALADITLDTSYSSVSALSGTTTTSTTWTWGGNPSQVMNGTLRIQISASRHREWATAGDENQDYANAGNGTLTAEYSTNGGTDWSPISLPWVNGTRVGDLQNGSFTDSCDKQIVEVPITGVQIQDLRLRLTATSQRVIVGASEAQATANADLYTAFFDQTS